MRHIKAKPLGTGCPFWTLNLHQYRRAGFVAPHMNAHRQQQSIPPVALSMHVVLMMVEAIQSWTGSVN
jgi:hypothetical protein